MTRSCWLFAALWGSLVGTAPAPAHGAPKPAASTATSLETAYKREFAFLEAEKRTLEQRLSTLDAELAEKTAAAEKELSAVQGRIMALTLEGDRQEAVLRQTEGEEESSKEGEDLVAAVLTQASAAFDREGLKLFGDEATDPKARLSRLALVFQKAIETLDEQGSVRVTEGSFFGPDGKKTSGKLVKIGNIAAYGVGEAIAGALAPAGLGELKVWPEARSDDFARALAQGKRPDVLEIFLYDSLEKDIETRPEKTIRETVDQGGVIGWMLVILGALSAVMIALRAAFLKVASASTDKLVDRVSPLVERGDIDGAVALCDRARSAAGRVLKATLRHLRSPREHLEDVVAEAVLREQPSLDRFGGAILVIAAVAPLLGLLGTVTGMISTFDIITEHGTGDPKLLSGGISEALVTTELGLVVAIPTLLIGTLLGGWAEGIKDAIDKAALRVTNLSMNVRDDDAPHQSSASVLEPLAS